MSTRTPDKAPAEDPNTARHPSRSRRLIASLAATALTGGLVAGGAAVYKQHSGGDTHRDSPSIGAHKTPPTKAPEKTPPAGPVRVEQLPGYGQQVTAEQRKALQASTVQIIRQVPDPKTGFYKQSNCDGIKVELGGGTYVATARHCLVDKGRDTTKEFPRSNSSPDLAHDPLITVPESLSGKVSIWTIGANGLADTQHPIPVRLAEASGSQDMALLSVDDASPNADKFNAVPAINLEAAMSGEPVPGAQAVLINNELGTKETETTGTYLGTSANPADRAQELAWILVDYNSADKDGCYYGESGSASAIGGAEGGVGTVTGPLAVRIQPHDSRDLSGEPENRLWKWRNIVADDLGVSLEDRNTTLCGFVPPNITQIIAHNMAQVANAQ
jgi:hypothetical protein